jgi:hypothetical protein
MNQAPLRHRSAVSVVSGDDAATSDQPNFDLQDRGGVCRRRRGIRF